MAGGEGEKERDSNQRILFQSRAICLPLKATLLTLLSGPQDAIKNNSFYKYELQIEKGDLKKGFAEADNVVSGTVMPCSTGIGQPCFVN